MPARFNCESSSLKPSGSTKCKTDFVAAHNRATLPVFGGISGSTRTMFIKYLPQNQPVRRCRHARDTSVTARQNIFDFRQWNFPLTDLNQSSHNAATHL